MLALAVAAYLPCVEPLGGGKYKEPPTLAALLDCQKKNLRRVKGADQPQVESQQEEEARQYLARHPDRASMQEAGDFVEAEEVPEAAQEEVEKADKTPEADIRPDTKSLEKMIWDRVPEQQQADSKLSAEKSAAVIGHIRAKNKGEVDNSTVDLLEAMTKDGAKPSEQTLELMRAKARDAKSKGFNVGMDPEVEDDLLRGVQQPRK